MTDADKAKEIARVMLIWSKGCGNTIPFNHPPENCPECAATILRIVESVLTGASFPPEETK